MTDLNLHLAKWLLPILAIGLFVSGCASAPDAVEEEEEAKLIVFPLPPDPPRFIYESTIFGTADVQPVTEEMRLRAMLTGETGVLDKGMSKPFGVAVHQGRIFVSDSVSRVVWAFDVPQGKSFEIGLKEPGLLGKPLGIDVDSSGRLYVIDPTFSRVSVYDRDGNFINTFGGSKLFSRPSGIAVTSDGAKVFVVDTGGVSSPNHRVLVFDGQSGEHLYNIGTRGTEPGQFNLPREAEIGPDGRLYVVDGGNFRIQVFEQDGTFVRQFGKIGRQFGQFSRPKGISLDAEGNVYVSDASFGNIQIFTNDGKLLMFMGSRGQANEPTQYMLTAGVDVDEDGRVYFVDQFWRRLDIYRPAGLPKDQGYLAEVIRKP